MVNHRTLTHEQVAEGWVAHDGGPCPVPLDSKPSVLFKDGFIHHQVFEAGIYGPLWHRRHLGRSIIAYKPEPAHLAASGRGRGG